METVIGYGLIFAFLVGCFDWYRKEREKPKGIDPSKLRQCPVCERTSAIIETYFDAEEGEKDILHCTDKRCNSRVKNWASPDYEERERTRKQDQIIDLANKRAVQQKNVLTRMTNNLRDLNSEIIRTQNEIRKSQHTLIEVKSGKEMEITLTPPPPTPSPEPEPFQNVEEAQYALTKLVAPQAFNKGEFNGEYDFPAEDAFGDPDSRVDESSEEPPETINEADRIALAELIADVKARL